MLVATDGNPGVMKVVEKVFPFALRQCCQLHRMQNILPKPPREAAELLKQEIHNAFHASSYEEGLRIRREVIERYRDRFPAAMGCLEGNLEARLQCLRLPKEHHRRIRTTNLLEQPFEEKPRRLKVIPHFFKERAGTKIVFATMLAVSQKWRGAKINPLIVRETDAVWSEAYRKSREELWGA